MNVVETIPFDPHPLPAAIQPPIYSIVAPVFDEAETLPHFTNA